MRERHPRRLQSTCRLCSMLFFFSKRCKFVLRSGSEHHALHHDSSLITVVEVPGQCAYLQYVKDVSKNNLGGLKGIKITAQKVILYANFNITALYTHLSCTTTTPQTTPSRSILSTVIEKGKTRLLVFKQSSWTQQT